MAEVGWGWSRWLWRRLVSMRTAVVLLCLLALTAVPGSLLPQRGVSSNPSAVSGFYTDHELLAPWLDRLGLFGVYSSPWFAAVYLLLLVSMVGCVGPRSWRLWRHVRARPVAGPRRLERLEVHRDRTLPADATHDAVGRLSSALRATGFRVDVVDGEVRAEKGYLRELGNLGFHLSLLVLLVGVGYGKLVGFEGRVVVVEGDSFTNTRAQYDAFTPNALTDVRRLSPFSVTLDEFDATYEEDGPTRGQPSRFDAILTVVPEPGATARTVTARPNEPLEVDGTKMFVTGNGYAPVLTVRDADGTMVTSGPVVFLPEDQNYASSGVLKVPDAVPEGLGFEGRFLPTAATGIDGPVSAFPDLTNPQVLLTGYRGDLNLQVAQSVFVLDKSGLTSLNADGTPFDITLSPGETATLPDGRGSISFDRVARFVNFQVAYDPGRYISLVAAILLLVGLTASLTIPRRRWWARLHEPDDGPARLEVGGLSLTRRDLPARDLELVDGVLAALGGAPTTEHGPDDEHRHRRYAHVHE